MPEASPAIIVLSQLDDRYFSDLSGYSKFTLDFKLFKKGDKRVLANSSHSTFFRRSVNAELDLDAGEYVVHVRCKSHASCVLFDAHGGYHSRLPRCGLTDKHSDPRYVVWRCAMRLFGHQRPRILPRHIFKITRRHGTTANLSRCSPVEPSAPPSSPVCISCPSMNHSESLSSLFGP